MLFASLASAANNLHHGVRQLNPEHHEGKMPNQRATKISSALEQQFDSRGARARAGCFEYLRRRMGGGRVLICARRAHCAAAFRGGGVPSFCHSSPRGSSTISFREGERKRENCVVLFILLSLHTLTRANVLFWV